MQCNIGATFPNDGSRSESNKMQQSKKERKMQEEEERSKWRAPHEGRSAARMHIACLCHPKQRQEKKNNNLTFIETTITTNAQWNATIKPRKGNQREQKLILILHSTNHWSKRMKTKNETKRSIQRRKCENRGLGKMKRENEGLPGKPPWPLPACRCQMMLTDWSGWRLWDLWLTFSNFLLFH